MQALEELESAGNKPHLHLRRIRVAPTILKNVQDPKSRQTQLMHFWAGDNNNRGDNSRANGLNCSTVRKLDKQLRRNSTSECRRSLAFNLRIRKVI